jgi:propionyl-CoA carboxylase beta chain
MKANLRSIQSVINEKIQKGNIKGKNREGKTRWGKNRIAEQHKKGKLTARERISLLMDPDHLKR